MHIQSGVRSVAASITLSINHYLNDLFFICLLKNRHYRLEQSKTQIYSVHCHI